VYTATLLVCVPLMIALVAAVALRQASSATRVLVWRGAIVAFLGIFLARALPPLWTAWILPDLFSAPLVALGRLQVAAAQPTWPGSGTRPGIAVAVFAVYLAGVFVVMGSFARGLYQLRLTRHRAMPPGGSPWLNLLDELRDNLGIRRRVSLRFVSSATAPSTWGVFRPVILLPSFVSRFPAQQRRAILLHELSHVGQNDWIFIVAARLACALFWFHPAAWFAARRLHIESEIACDDRVLRSGIRSSDYAGLLLRTLDELRPAGTWYRAAVPLSGRSGLRGRLDAIVRRNRDLRSPGLPALLLSFGITLAVTAPLGTVQLAPTRDLLTQLMLDSRWESRAYAVRGLAQRADSLLVAQHAAAADPSPQVRAWARAALLTSPTSPSR
jgi:beta-lactamase regulating signal transducer with metallopeptidase domain